MKRIFFKGKYKELSSENVFYVNHLESYMDKVRVGLCITLLYVLLSELTMFFIIRFLPIDFSSSVFFIKERWTANFAYVVHHLIVPNILNWSAYFIFLIIYKHANFYWKKISVCTVYLFCATVYCFGHWGFIYLSILYVIPVLLTCPMGKRTNTVVFIISFILQCVYCAYQYYLVHSIYNLLIAFMSFAALVGVYALCFCIFNAFMSLVNDTYKYEKLSAELQDEIRHDSLTGALSKQALFEEKQYLQKYSAVAFIDLDNFKQVNDKHSHEIGDEILKQLVLSFSNNDQKLFRYGGDEFIALSTKSVPDFTLLLQKAKAEFSAICKEKFGVETSFSAGVAHVSENSDLSHILEQADSSMYVAKKSGKNAVQA